MQMKDAYTLSEQWGDRDCNHPFLEKEYEREMSTGDYVCTRCGKCGPGRDWPDEERKSSEEPKA